jgi:hypothetical protein
MLLKIFANLHIKYISKMANSVSNIIISILSPILTLALLSLGPILAIIASRYSLPTHWRLFLLVICILYGVLPLLLLSAGISLAQHFNCKSNALTYTCPNNARLGDLISTMIFIGNWGPLITIPSGVLGIIGFIISFVLMLLRTK